MRIACTVAVLAAASTLAPRLAEGSCTDPTSGSSLTSSSFGSSTLLPVGPHPVLDRTLVASSSSMSLRDTGTLGSVSTLGLSGAAGTPIPVEMGSSGSGEYAAFVARSNGFIARVDVTDRSLSDSTAFSWPRDLTRAGCGSDTIDATPTVHLNRFATASFDAAYSGADLVYVATRYGCATGSTDNRVYALNAETGATEWVFNGSGSVDMDVVIADPYLDIENDRLYVATDRTSSTQDTLWAIDTLTGNKAWSANVGQVWAAPVVRDDVIYVVTLYGEMKALSVADGSVIWSLSNPGGNPVTTDMFTEFRNPFRGLIAVTDFAGDVWLVQDSGSSASTQWHTGGSLPAAASTRVAIDPDNGKLYVGASSGEIYQLSMVDGSFEASRSVTSSGSVGVPTLTFEDTDGDTTFDDVRMIAGSGDGSVAKFCLPWSTGSSTAAPATADPQRRTAAARGCKTAADCPQQQTQCITGWICNSDNLCEAVPEPNGTACGNEGQCFTSACSGGVCTPRPFADGRACDDGIEITFNEETGKDQCIAGTCSGDDDCDRNLDSCSCKDWDEELGKAVDVSRELRLSAFDDCSRNNDNDQCATEFVTLSALNQCLNHGTLADSVVTVHLFDQDRRPFTNAFVQMKILLNSANGTPPVWLDPTGGGEVISEDTVTTGEGGGILETERPGTYFALLGAQQKGEFTDGEDFQIQVDVKQTDSNGGTCVDTFQDDQANIRVGVSMGNPDLVCDLDSNVDDTGFLRIQVVQGGDPVPQAKVVVGHTEQQEFFFSDYRGFVVGPHSPDLANFDFTSDQGFVEFRDYGNQMNGPFDVFVTEERIPFCVQKADAVLDLDNQEQVGRCRDLRDQQ